MKNLKELELIAQAAKAHYTQWKPLYITNHWEVVQTHDKGDDINDDHLTYDLFEDPNKEICEYVADFNPEVVLTLISDLKKCHESLNRLRNDPTIWKKPGIGGQDQYAGLPYACRFIDSTLVQLEVK